MLFKGFKNAFWAKKFYAIISVNQRKRFVYYFQKLYKRNTAKRYQDNDYRCRVGNQVHGNRPPTTTFTVDYLYSNISS